MKIREIQKIIETEMSNKLVDTKKKPNENIIQAYEKVAAVVYSLLKQIKKDLNDIGEETITLTDEELKKEVRKNVIVGGGCLSDQFIPGYNGQSQDVDIFLGYHQLSNSIHMLRINTEIFLEMLSDELSAIGVFEKQNIAETHYSGMYIKAREMSVYRGVLNDLPGVEVEIIANLEAKIEYDLHFRHFYYNGGNILATENALQDIKEKKIRIKQLSSGISTLYRAREFAERYGFTVDEDYVELALYSLNKGMNFPTEKEFVEHVEKITKKIKKYKDTWTPEELGKRIAGAEITQDPKGFMEMSPDSQMNKMREHIVFNELVESGKIPRTTSIVYDVPKYRQQFDVADNLEIKDLEKIECIIKYVEENSKEIFFKLLFTSGPLTKEDIAHIGEMLKEVVKKEEKITRYYTERMWYQEYLNFKGQLIIAGKDTGKPILQVDTMNEYFGGEKEFRQSIEAEQVELTWDWKSWRLMNQINELDVMFVGEAKYRGGSTKEYKWTIDEKNINFYSEEFNYISKDRERILIEQIKKEVEASKNMDFEFTTDELVEFHPAPDFEVKEHVVRTETKQRVGQLTYREDPFGIELVADDDLPW